MATLTIKNVSAAPYYARDLYVTIAAGATITATRPASELTRMTGLQAALTAGTLTLAVTYSSDELGSGLMAPPAAIGADDMLPVASTAPASGLVLIRKAFTALVTGTADDVTVYAVNTLPFKMRVVDAWMQVSANVAGSSCNVWTRAAGTGTQLAALSSNATGRVSNTLTASAVATPGTLDGMFVRRSDRAAAGEVYVLARIET